MLYTDLTNLEVCQLLGYSDTGIAKMGRIIERQKRLYNTIITENGKRKNGKKLYDVEIQENEDQIPDGFIFKKELKGYQELAIELNSTYDSVKTNFNELVNRQLNRFDRLIIKKYDSQHNLHFTIYEKPSEKNSNLENEEWKECIFNTNYLISNYGRLKNKKDNFVTYGSLDTDGYYVFGSTVNGKKLRVHREVLKAFNPIDDNEKYYVDHINGIRSDNRLENLRWVTPLGNANFRDENNSAIQEQIAKLIQKYGYNETLEKLKKL